MITKGYKNLSECFDRNGERAKLTKALQEKKALLLVSGGSGVGKSKIIETVLDRKFGEHHTLKYEFGRSALSAIQHLLALITEEHPSKSKFIDHVKRVSISEFNLTIPFIGRAPIKWASDQLPATIEGLNATDIVNSLVGPIFEQERKQVEKISTLLPDTSIKAIWLANCEVANSQQFADLCLIAEILSYQLPIIVEGAFSELRYIEIEKALTKLSHRANLQLTCHKIMPFNSVFAQKFHEHIGAAENGARFNFARNSGYPVAIKYDLNASLAGSEIGGHLQEGLEYSDNSRKTLLFLCLCYNIENRYGKLIQLAEQLNINLEFEKLIELDVIRLSEERCELAHPKISQFLSLTKRQELYRIIREAIENVKSKFSIELDLLALEYNQALSGDKRMALIKRGIDYVFSFLSENNFQAADNALAFVEQGYESFKASQREDPIEKQIALARDQIDTLLCRRTGVAPSTDSLSVCEILLLAQSRMRRVKLRDAIVLCEIALAKLGTPLESNTSFNNWFCFCANYITASCQIALGEFKAFSVTKFQLELLAQKGSEREERLLELLPGSIKPQLSDFCELPNEGYFAGRQRNNLAANYLLVDTNCVEIEEALRKSVEIIASEGSVEVTFPMNNLGLALLYKNKIYDAINLFYDSISFSIYQYDYFSAYNNLAIALAASGDLVQANEYLEKACHFLEAKELSDPVFEIKGLFNRAVVARSLGDYQPWRSLMEGTISFSALPERYEVIFNSKLKEIEASSSIKSLFIPNTGGSMETASILWPQNLQFWDFLYPIAVSENYNDIVSHSS